MPPTKKKGKGKKPATPQKKHMAGDYPLSEDQVSELKKVFSVFTKGSMCVIPELVESLSSS